MQSISSAASDSPTTLRSTNPIDVFLVLRAVACLMVVIIHGQPPRNSIYLLGMDLSWLLFSNGRVAVWILFCLSGYLMGKAFYRDRYPLSWHGVLHFWRNRALRIVPLYGFVLLVFSILVYPEILQSANLGTLLRLCTFTYQPFVSPHPLRFNGVLWTISTEVQFYLIVPFLYSLCKRHVRSRRAVYSAIALIIFAIFVLKLLIWLPLQQQIHDSVKYDFTYWYAPLITNLDVFLVGFLMNPLLCLAHRSVPSEERRTQRKWRLPKLLKVDRVHQVTAVILLILLYLFTAHHAYAQELLMSHPTRNYEGVRTTTTLFILQPVTALVTAYFIVAFERNAPTFPVQMVSWSALLQNPWRILEVFGHLSYGIYLWHYSIMEEITPFFTSELPIEAFFRRLIMTLFLSIILSTVTYCTIELPAARWKIYRPAEPRSLNPD